MYRIERIYQLNTRDEHVLTSGNDNEMHCRIILPLFPLNTYVGPLLGPVAGRRTRHISVWPLSDMFAKCNQALLNVEKLTLSNVQTPADSLRPSKGERSKEKKLKKPIKTNMFQNQFMLFAFASFQKQYYVCFFSL